MEEGFESRAHGVRVFQGSPLLVFTHVHLTNGHIGFHVNMFTQAFEKKLIAREEVTSVLFGGAVGNNSMIKTAIVKKTKRKNWV